MEVEGVLTMALGAIESGRGGFVQDITAGIALYLDAALVERIPAGTRVRASGQVASRYAQRTLRVTMSDVTVVGLAGLPSPDMIATGSAGEPVEGRRVDLSGVVSTSPEDLADGLGLMVDDGSGPVRVIVGPDALGAVRPEAGMTIRAIGPLGQRDSSGTGTTGYRLYATLPGELELAAPPPSPTPLPTATPTPTSPPSPTPLPTATPSPTPTPTFAPTAAPVPVAADVAAARAVPVGGEVIVRGVVIAEAGRLGTPPLIAIGDATAGLPVRLPDDALPPARGSLVEVRGRIADPYGQTELRVASGGLAVLGATALPAPVVLAAGDVNEGAEGRLAVVRGTVTTSATRATSGDISFTLTDEDGAPLRVFADASAGLEASAIRAGLSATFTGVVGQRASRKGALDGYRLWVRDAADITPTAPAAVSAPSPAPAAIVPIMEAIARDGERVVVEGILTVGTQLLDASNRRTVVEDSTGAIEIYLAAPTTALRPGLRVRASGTVARAYGAPRLRADEVVVLGMSRPVVGTVGAPPTAAVEWRLVRASGVVVELHRLGTRWRAELDVNGVRIPVSGLEGSGIPSTALIVGRRATLTGIVRRPYPTATDQRFAIVPRERGDVALGPQEVTQGAAAGSTPPLRAPVGSGVAGGAGAARDRVSIQDVDNARLEAHLGQVVRIGGIVAALAADGVDLDDGTATVRVVLAAGAAPILGLLGPGDALNAVGTPEIRDAVVLVVDDPLDLVLAGDPGAPATVVTTPGPAFSPGRADPELVRASVGRGAGLDLAPAGLGTLLLLGCTSLAVTAARRHRARRILQARIVARLQAMGWNRPAAGDPG